MLRPWKDQRQASVYILSSVGGTPLTQQTIIMTKNPRENNFKFSVWYCLSIAYDPQKTRIILRVNKYKPRDDWCHVPTCSRATLLAAQTLINKKHKVIADYNWEGIVSPDKKKKINQNTSVFSRRRIQDCGLWSRRVWILLKVYRNVHKFL